MTRLVSAERSCGITVDGVGACSCRIATHAMCASVCATSTIGVVEFAGLGAEQTERAQHDAGRAHRHGMHRGEAGVVAAGTNRGQRAISARQVGDRDRLRRWQ